MFGINLLWALAIVRTELVGLSLIENQRLANLFGHAFDDAEANRLDFPDLWREFAGFAGG